MSKFALFTDGSLSPGLGWGVGAALLVSLPLADGGDFLPAAGQMCYKRFTETTCSRLELQTLLWGITLCREQQPAAACSLTVYTDSQGIAGLATRRSRLERTGFSAARSGRELAAAALYREFYAAADELGFALIRLAGHAPAARQDREQRLFTLVDRGARRELRRWLAGEAPVETAGSA